MLTWCYQDDNLFPCKLERDFIQKKRKQKKKAHTSPRFQKGVFEKTGIRFHLFCPDLNALAAFKTR